MERPNVLIIIPHDLGDHLGCYGHRAVPSPHLDRFAKQGTRLTNYFAAAPECTPSRAAMFTGLHTHQTGLMGLCHRGWEFDLDATHLAQYLQQANYETHLFGVQHETGIAPERLGYTSLHSQENLSCGPVAHAVTEFLKSEASTSQPWFACVGFLEVHRVSGWPKDPDISPNDVELPPYLPDNNEMRQEFARYYASIREMDTACGAIFDTLSTMPQLENTLVIFTSDHGIPFPKAKSTFYDSGIRTPMLLQWPGRLRAGAEFDELMSNLDLCPTVLEACGVTVPANLEGRSFLPLLEGKSYREHEAIFGELYYDAAYDPMYYVRTRRYKYIRSFAVTEAEAASADQETLTSGRTGAWIRADDSDVQNCAAWPAMCDSSPPVDPEELYDVEIDPLETTNIVNDEASRPVLEELRRLLHEMMERTDSPLLTGHVQPDRSSSHNQPIHR